MPRPKPPTQATDLYALCRVLLTISGMLGLVHCEPSEVTSDRDSVSLAVILAKRAASRPFRGRLVGMSYAPIGARQGLQLSALPLDTLANAQQLLKDGGSVVEAARNRVAFELWTGHADRALPIILEAVEAAPRAASLWTELSGVYLELSVGQRPDLRMAARALEAATHALELEPSEPAAVFNRVSALDSLGLVDAGREDLAALVALEGESRWTNELHQALQEKSRAGDEWVKRRDMLLASDAAGGDWLRETAEQWRQETRETLENALLPEWGRAVASGDEHRASRLLERAHLTAAYLATATSDSLLRQSLDAIVSARAPVVRALAAGHVAYGEGVAAYEATRREEARAKLGTAYRLLADAGSPFALKAQVQTGIILYQLNHFTDAERVCASVAAVAERKGFVALLARARWLLGLAAMQQSRVEEAVRSFKQAREGFAASGELEDLAGVAGAAADTLRRIGEHAEGWYFLSESLSGLHWVRAPRRRLTILLNASLFSADDGLQRAALMFQDASLRAAADRGVPATIVEGLTRRARLRLGADDRVGAARDLDAAERLIPSVSSPSQHEYASAWLRWVRAEWQAQPNPEAAMPLFKQAKSAFARAEPDEVPRLSVGLGLAALQAGRLNEAASYLDDGLRIFEARSENLSRDQYRVSYADDGWRLFDALVRLHAIERRDIGRGFDFAERGRARSLGMQARVRSGATLDGVRAMLPEASSLLYYSVLEDRLLIWVVEPQGVLFRDRPITRAALYGRVLRYRRLIESMGSEAALLQESQALHEILIPREVRGDDRLGSLVVVADGLLNTVPFATLVDRGTNRYLAEDRPVLVAPSATHAVRRDSRATERAAGLRCLLVGGTATGAAAARLGRLPHAAAEMAEVARCYPAATLLKDEDATVSALGDALAGQDVLHFAGHAVANESFPWRSRLLLAPDSAYPEGGASLDVLRRLDFSQLRLVVLSACRTASGPEARGEGVISLMRPFLQQLVPAVVGTLWDIDDAAARALLARFHAAYVRDQDPVAAMNEAQRDLLGSDEAVLRHPRSWGGFVVSSSLN